MKILKRCLVLTVAFAVLISGSVFADSKVITAGNEAKFFDAVATEIPDFYQFDMDKQELIERTVRTLLNENPEMLDTFLAALFDSLDDYSEFYTPEEYEEISRFYENVTGGIGVSVSKKGRYVEVASTLDDGSAKKAGIIAGDKIFAVDGEEMTDKPLDYVTSKMKGEIGTKVNITILRDDKKIEFKLERCVLKLESVYSAKLTDKLGYIQITQFVNDTASEFKTALDEMDKAGITDIIIDLRNNTGGLVSGAVDIAKLLVPEGTIITHHMKYKDTYTTYTSELKEKKYNLVTLVNEYTASSSEILASALSESKASVLVGNQTYGKAVTQNILGLYGGRACKITTGEYFTRNGNSINKVGIIPDYTVENKTLPLSQTTVKKFVYNAAGYKAGDNSEGVKCLNQRLAVLGYSVSGSEYGEDTVSAVKSFQAENGIEPTGICDIVTQTYIVSLSNEKNIYIDMQLKKALDLMNSDYEIYLEK